MVVQGRIRRDFQGKRHAYAILAPTGAAARRKFPARQFSITYKVPKKFAVPILAASGPRCPDSRPTAAPEGRPRPKCLRFRSKFRDI